MKKEKKICSECGQEIQGEAIEIDGESVCESCFDEYFFYCDDCGKVERKDYGYWIDDADKLVCDNCINNYHHCEDCGNYFENATYIENRGYVCEDCYERNNYGYCENCGRYYDYDYIHYSERNDEYYCENCYEEEDNDGLFSYHAFNDWCLFKGKNEENAPYYIGKEIELEPKNYNCLSEVIEVMQRKLNAVGMEDGSLNSGSIEVVTHPESWQYLLEHKNDYEEFFEEMEKMQYGDDGNTGLHFHVTRPNENVISRIIVILESFKEEIKKLSRRNGDFHWSKFISDYENSDIEKIKYQSTKYIKEKYLNAYHDRYVALNLNNTKTIEFRFFKGANNFEEFWGALQFIHNIMEVALDETREINTIEWKELINGTELIAQAQKQNVLDVDKKAKDTTEITEKLEKRKEEVKEEIRKTLKNFIRYMTREMESKKLEIIDRNDIEKIEEKSRSYINQLSNDLRYLESVSNAYRAVDTNSLQSLKIRTNGLKDDAKYYNKENQYTYYFKKIEKIFKEFESEVLA